jgi:hypothetical protein
MAEDSAPNRSCVPTPHSTVSRPESGRPFYGRKTSQSNLSLTEKSCINDAMLFEVT